MQSEAVQLFTVRVNLHCVRPAWCVDLWGASPLCVNPVNATIALTQTLADGKGGTARSRLKEAREQSCEPTNRNGI